QHLALAFVHQFHGFGGGGFAMRGIDHLEAADLNAMLVGNLVNPGGGSDEGRLDDAEFRGLHCATKRSLVTRMHPDSQRRCNLFRLGDETVVFRSRRMSRRADGAKSAYFALSFSWHGGSDRFAKDVSARLRRFRRCLSCTLRGGRLVPNDSQSIVFAE